MEIKVRPMIVDDIPIIVDWMLTIPLWQQYKLQKEATIVNFRDGLDRGDWLIVADSDVPACGFAWCLPKGMFGFMPYLKLLGVHPDYHSQNMGGKLLNHLEGLVTAEDKNALFLLVSDFNEAAQRFYLRQGYQEIGSVPHLVLPDVNELIFWKSL